jgi:hypothetical protein
VASNLSPRQSRQAGRADIEQLLDVELGAFDQLMAEVRQGIRGPAHFDALEERASGIASGLRGAFRVRNQT